HHLAGGRGGEVVAEDHGLDRAGGRADLAADEDAPVAGIERLRDGGVGRRARRRAGLPHVERVLAGGERLVRRGRLVVGTGERPAAIHVEVDVALGRVGRHVDQPDVGGGGGGGGCGGCAGGQ